MDGARLSGAEQFRSHTLLWCTWTDFSAGPGVYLRAAWKRMQAEERKEVQIMGCAGVWSSL